MAITLAQTWLLFFVQCFYNCCFSSVLPSTGDIVRNTFDLVQMKDCCVYKNINTIYAYVYLVKKKKIRKKKSNKNGERKK